MSLYKDSRVSLEEIASNIKDINKRLLHLTMTVEQLNAILFVIAKCKNANISDTTLDEAREILQEWMEEHYG